MSDPRAYMLILADAGRDKHPDLRLIQFLRTLDKYGFSLANAQGSDPPSPGLLETITLEHGVRYDDAGFSRAPGTARDDGDQALLGEDVVYDAGRYRRHAREMRGHTPIAIPSLGAGRGAGGIEHGPGDLRQMPGPPCTIGRGRAPGV